MLCRFAATSIACLTPLVVLLFDVAEPGHSEWMIAGMRTAYTIAGALALLAGLVLWPSWEPQRVRQELLAALQAHARFACIILSDPPSAEPDDNPTAPFRGRRAAMRNALLADAALRRLGASLMTLEHAPRPTGPDREAWQQWAAWLPEALTSITYHVPPPPPPLSFIAAVWRDLAERIQRQVEMLGDVALTLDRDYR